jgi:glycosyltransferase involved in cell wall biosynthesis
MQQVGETRPDVSVIVPTYNRRERLGRLLDTLRAEAAGSVAFEVVVVVDGDVDGAAAMARGLATPYPLQVLCQTNAGPAAARNRAVQAAGGELLLFLDDDVSPAPGIVAAHSRHHATADDLVVIGPMLPPAARLAPWLTWEAMMLRKQYDAMIAGVFPPTPRQFYTANASVRRDRVLTAGGFDERYRRAEDVELAYRLRRDGARFLFDPRAVVTHQPDRSLQSWRRVGYEYGRFDTLMTRDGVAGPPLGIAAREWPQRHVLVRALARACVGHRWRMASLRGVLPLFLAGGDALRLDRACQLACSAVFNVEDWQGVADATGTGSHLWGRLDALSQQQTPARQQPAGQVALEPASGAGKS